MESQGKKPEAPAAVSGPGVSDENAPSNPGFSVYWENDQDPENPLNWPNGRKWGIIGILSFMCFLT